VSRGTETPQPYFRPSKGVRDPLNEDYTHPPRAWKGRVCANIREWAHAPILRRYSEEPEGFPVGLQGTHPGAVCAPTEETPRKNWVQLFSSSAHLPPVGFRARALPSLFVQQFRVTDLNFSHCNEVKWRKTQVIKEDEGELD